MSTERINTTQHRFAKLARMHELVFHAGDLANLWNIQNKNTLYTTLKRYTQQALIYRIYKGLYSILPLVQIDPWLLGVKAMHSYCYISTETILAQAGIIQQQIQYTTLVGMQSKRFAIGENHYYCRQLTDKFLFNSSGIVKKNKINVATVERAVADLLHFNPHAYLDGAANINWKQVEQIQINLGYEHDSSPTKRRST
jgi:predicted transcriptional regulator of viral defense system